MQSTQHLVHPHFSTTSRYTGASMHKVSVQTYPRRTRYLQPAVKRTIRHVRVCRHSPCESFGHMRRVPVHMWNHECQPAFPWLCICSTVRKKVGQRCMQPKVSHCVANFYFCRKSKISEFCAVSGRRPHPSITYFQYFPLLCIKLWWLLGFEMRWLHRTWSFRFQLLAASGSVVKEPRIHHCATPRHGVLQAIREYDRKNWVSNYDNRLPSWGHSILYSFATCDVSTTQG